LNRLAPARAPCSVLSGHPCHPSFCDVFHLGPCFPQYLPPLGQDLQLTIVSTDGDATENARESAGSDAERRLDLGQGRNSLLAGYRGEEGEGVNRSHRFTSPRVLHNTD
jgi:hypothetical protein